MKLGSIAGRESDLTDIVVLLLTVWVALVTWSYFAETAGVSPWRLCVSVGFTLLCALATLTRHPRRAMAIRLMLGGWLISAPYLLAFADMDPVLRTYLVAGTVLTAMSSYAIVGRVRDTVGVSA